MNNIIKFYCFSMLSLLVLTVYGKDNITQKRVFGVTIDDPWKNLKGIKKALASHRKRPTVRIVFDERIHAIEYKEVIETLKPVSFIMGEILDSYYVKTYSLNEYTDRTREYVNLFKNDIDIWEIGNEVNGDWLVKNGTSRKLVAKKVNNAFNIVKKAGLKTAINFYYNASWKKDMPNYEMFNWIHENISNDMKTNLDYVFFSYYEDDCDGVVHTQKHWQKVFDRLHKIFPKAKLGFGEVGTKKHHKKAVYMKRYYSLNITTPNYIGGYFWWYYAQDCVPKSKPLWKTLERLNPPKKSHLERK